MSAGDTAQPAAPLEQTAAELLLQGNRFLRLGDWRRGGAPLTVIQELTFTNRRVLLMRAGNAPRLAPALYVDLENGRLIRMDGLTFIDGIGRLGQRLRFDDGREVGGALLPLPGRG
jgi:hypothetical protein